MELLYLMGQSLTHLLVHAIFSTKDRRSLLGDSRNFQTPQGRLRRTLCLAFETPKARTPLQGASLDVTSPRAKAQAKAPGLFC